MLRWLFVALAVAGLVLVGAYFEAKSSVANRVRRVVERIREIGVDRAGHLPDEDTVATRVQRFAREAPLSIEAVEVSREGRAQPLSRAMETGLSTLKGAGAADGLGSMPVRGHVYKVRARLWAKRWLWTHTHALDVTFRVMGDLSQPGAPPNLRGPVDAE